MNNIAEKFSQEECSALLGLHAFTGRDTCCAFTGTGKIKPIKVLQKNAKFNNMLARLGDSWEVSDDMVSDAEELTCVFYRKPRFKSVNELRFHLLKAKCGSEDKITNNRNVGISNMLPCSDSLREHVRRVNYQVAIWKRACVTKPDVPNPSTGHGWILKDNILEPLWTSGNILPQQMVDILDTYEDEECSNADSDMERNEFEFAEYESSDDEESNDASDN